MKIKQLECLPNFYSREEIKQKHKEIKNKIDELVVSGKLFQREEEKLKTYDEEFPLYSDNEDDEGGKFVRFSFPKGTEQCPCCGVNIEWSYK